MDLKTRHVEVAGIVREAYEKWMLQVLRNLTDAVDGFLLEKTHLIMDRDPVFTVGVRGCSGAPKRNLFACRVAVPT